METKKINFEDLIKINGGAQVMRCDNAIIIGAIVGSWFGGVGWIIGAIGVAVGPNCLGWIPALY